MTEKNTSPRDRVVIEHNELSDKFEKLSQLLSKEKPSVIDDKHWSLLKEQHDYMNAHKGVLERRLSIMQKVRIAIYGAPLHFNPTVGALWYFFIYRQGNAS